LGNVRDIEVGPDGTVYVLDGSAMAVRVFGPRGEFLRSIGRGGEGPGEFRRPMQIIIAPDGGLWVYDDGPRAITSTPCRWTSSAYPG
jgi:streptogramin lyase